MCLLKYHEYKPFKCKANIKCARLQYKTRNSAKMKAGSSVTTSGKVFREYYANLSILFLKRPANFELSVWKVSTYSFKGNRIIITYFSKLHISLEVYIKSIDSSGLDSWWERGGTWDFTADGFNVPPHEYWCWS